MSTEQSESAHSQDETQTTRLQVHITQQETTPTATTTTQHTKNPKRVAAGKLVAERTRMAREQQKKAAATTAAPEPAPTTEDESPKNSSLSTTQWLAVGSLIVSLVGLYYKREELKTVFSKKTPEPASVETQPARTTQPKGVRHMD